VGIQPLEKLEPILQVVANHKDPVGILAVAERPPRWRHWGTAQLSGASHLVIKSHKQTWPPGR
jgi:hypothetical protein